MDRDFIPLLIAFASKWRQATSAKLSQLEYPNLVTFSCPNCGEGIPNFSVSISSGHDRSGVQLALFRCPMCKSLLFVSRAYRSWFMVCWHALAFIIPSILRIGPWYLWLGAVVLTWALLGFLASVYVKVLFPPKILKYEGPAILKTLDNPDDLPINPWRKL